MFRTIQNRFYDVVDYLYDTWFGKILRFKDTEPTELITGGLLKWLVGTWLLLPFKSFTSSPTFTNLGGPESEPVWAVVLMSLGAVHLLILKHGNRVQRCWMSFIGAVIWFALAFSFIVANPPAFGAMLLFTASFSQMWCYIRLRG